MLPCGVPKEWIQLHYKSLKRRKAAKAQAEQRAARLIAERATLPRDDPVRNTRLCLCCFASPLRTWLANVMYCWMHSRAALPWDHWWIVH